MELRDLAGISEPTSKLIGAVKDAIGVLYEPRRIKEKAKAEAGAAIIKAKGDAKVKEIGLRTQQRLMCLEERRQKNIESVVRESVKYLPAAVNPEPVDEDWIFQFFSLCQDIINETMQTLWAKLLAGEVTKPRSYSYRTLQTVKTMRKEEAELFTKYCGLLWYAEGKHTALLPGDTEEFLKEQGFSYASRLHLENLGLVNSHKGIKFDENTFTLEYFNHKYKITFHPDKLKEQYKVMGDSMVELKRVIAADILTEVGEELFPISGASANESYMEHVTGQLSLVPWTIQKEN
jgi:hypothetical protein